MLSFDSLLPYGARLQLPATPPPPPPPPLPPPPPRRSGWPVLLEAVVAVDLGEATTKVVATFEVEFCKAAAAAAATAAAAAA